MSMAGVWAGEAVEDSVSDDNKETSASSQQPLQMAGEARNAEALMAIDLEGSSEYLLELIVDNLRQLGQASHGAFLQRLLRGLTSVEVTEKESIVHWEKILARRNELTEKLGRPVLAEDSGGGLLWRITAFAETHPVGIRRTREVAP